MGSGINLKKAFKKYGIESFKKEILRVCSTEEEAYEFERKIIQERNAHKDKNYYNIAYGGAGFTSEESKALWKDESVRAKYIEAMQNRDLKGGNNPKAKKIICLNDSNLFDTIREASNFYNIGESEICAMCKGRYISVINKNTKERLAFSYYDDYLKLSQEDINNKILNANDSGKGKNSVHSKKVVCVNTGEVFDSASCASKKYNLNRAGISDTCRGDRDSYGSMDGKRILWMFYEEYKKLSAEEIQDIKENLKKHMCNKVVCLNTKEIFESPIKAARKYNLNRSSISNVCRKIYNSCGFLNGKPMVWMYLAEYENLLKYNDNINDLINSIIDNCNIKEKRVVCLNTLEVFNSIEEACVKYNISRRDLTKAFNGEKDGAGIVDEEWGLWMLYSEYISMTDEEINLFIKTKKRTFKKYKNDK